MNTAPVTVSPAPRKTRRRAPKPTPSQLSALENVEALTQAAARLRNQVQNTSWHRPGSHESVLLHYLSWGLQSAIVLYQEAQRLGLPLHLELGEFGKSAPRLRVGAPPVEMKVPHVHRTYELVIHVDFKRGRRVGGGR